MEVAQLGGHRDRVVMGDEKGFASFRNQPARQASSANGVTVCASYSPTALALMKVVLKPTTVATACSSTCKDLALLYLLLPEWRIRIMYESRCGVSDGGWSVVGGPVSTHIHVPRPR